MMYLQTEASLTAPTSALAGRARTMVEAELETALEELHPASFTWALRCCGGRREEAEDVVQTAYLKILDGRARFGGRSSLKTWLFAVLRRTAAEQRRRRLVRRVRRAVLAGSLPPGSGQAEPEPAARLDAARRLEGLLERLSARQREVLHLVFYQDLTIEESAAVMGVSLGTARTHYERGKRALRDLLARRKT